MLGFYTTIFFIVGLSMGGEWSRCFFALTGVYGLAFFGLAAGWFWARWYTQGIGISGITTAALGLITSGWNPALAIWGGMHLAIYLPLLGEGMADRYENRPEWRERYNMDDYGVDRLRRAVKSAATSLPILVFYALAPKQDQAALVGILALAGLGLLGLVRLRFWGVAALGVAMVWSVVTAGSAGLAVTPFFDGAPLDLSWFGYLAAGALAVAVSPFVVPAWRALRRPLD
jgi:hypothetical protein